MAGTSKLGAPLVDDRDEHAASEAARRSAAATRTEGSALRRRYRLASSARSSSRSRAWAYWSCCGEDGFIRGLLPGLRTIRVYAERSRPELSVASVAQTRHDVAVLVQVAVHRANIDVHVRVRCLQRPDALWRGDQPHVGERTA